jgi:hypothetical protein
VTSRRDSSFKRIRGASEGEGAPSPQDTHPDFKCGMAMYGTSDGEAPTAQDIHPDWEYPDTYSHDCDVRQQVMYSR